MVTRATLVLGTLLAATACSAQSPDGAVGTSSSHLEGDDPPPEIVVGEPGDDPADDPGLRFNADDEPDLPVWTLSTDAYADYGIRVVNQNAYGLDVVTGPHYWGTAEAYSEFSEDGEAARADQRIVAREQDFAAAANGQVFVVGTHGNGEDASGMLQSLPPMQLMTSVSEDGTTIVLSVCSASQSNTYGDQSLTARLALAWGANPSRVVGCTGRVVPISGAQAMRLGTAIENGNLPQPTLLCVGFWVSGNGERVTPVAQGVSFARYGCTGDEMYCNLQPDP
ncbi:MAG: hypothetical protein U0235_07500 [Polyangiaceae bacterium]